MSITPTPAQAEAIIDLVTTGRQVSRLHGYAGTGKTTGVASAVARQIERHGQSIQPLAPTGKAAKVLRSKGLHSAATIHSYLYTPSKRERPEWREAWDDFYAWAATRQPALSPVLAEIDAATSATDVDDMWKALIEKAGAKVADKAKRLQGIKRYQLSFAAAGAIAHYEETGYPASDVLLIDEASMVSEQVAGDLERTGSRLIYVGDPAQLPPVGARAARDAMGSPHHLLTEVHRQKGGSPVLKLATRIREADHPEAPPTKPGKLDRLEEYGQVLCWRNATRERVNAEIRRRLGRRDPMMPEAGDRLVCIKNTKELKGQRRWMNGEQVEVLDVGKGRTKMGDLILAIRDDEGAEHQVTTTPDTLGGHKAEQDYLDKGAWGSPDPAFAYGFALTVHKSQGSEWPSILLVDESADMIAVAQRREGRAGAIDQARRWLYTAVTRARDRVDVVRDLRQV